MKHKVKREEAELYLILQAEGKKIKKIIYHKIINLKKRNANNTQHRKEYNLPPKTPIKYLSNFLPLPNSLFNAINSSVRFFSSEFLLLLNTINETIPVSRDNKGS